MLAIVRHIPRWLIARGIANPNVALGIVRRDAEYFASLGFDDYVVIQPRLKARGGIIWVRIGDAEYE